MESELTDDQIAALIREHVAIINNLIEATNQRKVIVAFKQELHPMTNYTTRPFNIPLSVSITKSVTL